MRFVSSLILIVLAGESLSAQTTQPAATQPAPASQPASQPARPPAPPFSPTGPTMTGDWFGLRPALRDAGIQTSFFYNNHFMSVLDGGRTTGGGKNSATIDWIITLDLDKMGLIDDADMLVHARDGWGYSINPYTGTTRALDVNDDADGKQDLYIDQLWYRHYFFDHKLALQVGYLDFQTIVDRNAYANIEDRQFMNTCLDNSAVIPTAATTGLGAAVYIQPVNWYTLILGAGDAQAPTHGAPNPFYQPGFSTAFHDQAWFVGYIEHDFNLRIPGPRGPLTGNYRFGMVYDPRPRPRFLRAWETPDNVGDEWGFYTSCDQLLFRENARDEQGLGVFFRYGYRHQEINRFSDFWSGGVSYTGLIPDRNQDVLGVGFGHLVSSDNFGRRINRDAGEETVYEVYYAVQVTPWLVISPDLQYVDNPGANDSISHAIVGGVRARVSF